jgi:hypothetical protein
MHMTSVTHLPQSPSPLSKPILSFRLSSWVTMGIPVSFAGLTPIMLLRSVQARFISPMAISLRFGVLFATLITLFLIPCLYMMLDDAAGIAFRIRERFGIAGTVKNTEQ